MQVADFLNESLEKGSLHTDQAFQAQMMQKYWCPICSTFYCLGHMVCLTIHAPGEHCTRNHPLPFCKGYPTIKSSSLTLYKDLEPCGDDCFLLHHSMDTWKEHVVWSKQEEDFFRLATDTEPDSLPCHLSVIIDKPCIEVYFKHMELYPDEMIADVPSADDDLVNMNLQFSEWLN